MIRERLREYFSFSRKERIGVIVLVSLILVVFILPVFFHSSKNTIDQDLINKYKNEIASPKTEQQMDSSDYSNTSDEPADRKNPADAKSTIQHSRNSNIHLFYFDPNTISSKQWEKLGINSKTVHTIQNYISHGGHFHKPEDLKKIYGMNERDYQLLLPFVQIKTAIATNPEARGYFLKKETGLPRHNSPLTKIEINTADSVSLISLPGIGSKLAARILRFRERLGGFYEIGQVAETYGLPDSVYQQIKSFLYLEHESVRQIDINTADVPMLAQHPYIRWEIARAIVQFRQAHGPYKSVEDLGQIAILNGDKLKKLSPYLKIN
jgi:DNA uptake protein ComE-like DNA-binding protein